MFDGNFLRYDVCFPKNHGINSWKNRDFVPVLQLYKKVEPGARRSCGRRFGAGFLVELPTPPCAAWRAAAKAEAAAASDGSRDGRRGGTGTCGDCLGDTPIAGWFIMRNPIEMDDDWGP